MAFQPTVQDYESLEYLRQKIKYLHSNYDSSKEPFGGILVQMQCFSKDEAAWMRSQLSVSERKFVTFTWLYHM